MENNQENSSTNIKSRLMLVKRKVSSSTKTTTSFKEGEGNEKIHHICSECNKSFGSGKALGGHMSSAHVQPNKLLCNNSLMKKLNNNKIITAADDDDHLDYSDDKGQIICRICAKDFPSRKALFGHMRCHPEREWRGMAAPPPPPPPDKEAMSNPNPPVVDLSEGLHPWSVKAKRGTRGASASIVITDDIVPNVPREAEEDEETTEHEVEINRGFEQQLKRQRVEVFPGKKAGIRVFPPMTTERKSYSTEAESGKLEKGKEVTPISGIIETRATKNDNCSSDRTESDNELKRIATTSSMKKEKKKGKEKMKKDDEYKCNVCNKSFATYQALGGHRSSHNKFKISIFNAIDHYQDKPNKHNNHKPPNHDHDQERAEAAARRKATHEGVHECGICNKVFPTGQALGGHKRSHWTSSTLSEEVEEKVNNTNFEIDLNKPPNMEDDDGMDR